MDPTPSAAAPPPDRDAQPRAGFRDLHRRSWELELLISGAVLLVLLQVPGPVDRWYRHVEPTLAGGSELTVFFFYYYLKLTLYALITGLVAHLALRAYWVGLIGLDTVFPRGIRWEQVRVGPRQRELMRARVPSMRAMIRSTGNLASVVFGATFAFVWVFIMSVVLVAVAVAVAALASALIFGGERLQSTLWTVIGILLAVTVLPMNVDRWLGDRLRPGGRADRWLRRALAFASAVTLQQFYAPINNLLYSNLGKRAYFIGLYVAMVLFAGTFTVRDVLAAGGALRFGGGGYIADRGGALAVQDAYYDARRIDPWSFPRLPSIPAEVARGPWLRLFVPYDPERDADAVGATCPDLERVAPTGVRIVSPRAPAQDEAGVRAAIRCLSGLWRVTLDGSELSGLEWRYGTRTGTELPGLVTFVPVEGLARGAHLLALEWQGPPEDAPRPGEEREAPLRHDVPFWY